MYSLAINMVRFAHLLKEVDFDAIVDHLALTHILKCKAEPTTARIKRLLEVLSCYSFTFYHIKGEDLIFSNYFLDKNMMIVIHMRLYLYCLIYKTYCIINENEQEKYLVQTRSQAKSSGTILS